MANLKNITDLPVAESAEGLNLIVNDNGAAKQIAADAVGAQADWSVTDATSPAYILNKPDVVQADWAETDETSMAFIKNKPAEWDAIIQFGGDTSSWQENIMAATFVTGNYDLLYSIITSGELPKVLVRMEYNYGDDFYYIATPISYHTSITSAYIEITVSIAGTRFRFFLNADGTIDNVLNLN